MMVLVLVVLSKCSLKILLSVLISALVQPQFKAVEYNEITKIAILFIVDVLRVLIEMKYSKIVYYDNVFIDNFFQL